MKRVVIVGGGIVGASIAWHLAKAGAEVTVIEKECPAAGATGSSFAWINATFSKRPIHYFKLNLLGVAAWKRLQAEMAEPVEIEWGGSVEWYAEDPEAALLKAAVPRHQWWGYSTRVIEEDELRRLVPGLTPGPVDVAAFSNDEGVLDPVAATNQLLRDSGAWVAWPCEVTSLEMAYGKVTGVVTTQGTLPCDVVVVAAGVGTPRVAAMAGVQVPLKDSPGVLAHSVLQGPLLERVVLGPRSHIRQGPGGRVVAGDNFAGGEALDGSLERGEELLKRAAGYLPGIDARLEGVTLGWRVMPLDEHPIVGFAEAVPNLYIVATHSGVTLAALLGEYAVTEILKGSLVEMLAPYRLARFG